MVQTGGQDWTNLAAYTFPRLTDDIRYVYNEVTNAALNGSRQLIGQLLTVGGQTYTIEASTNLVNWFVRGTLFATNSVMPVLDPDAVARFPRLFYRLRIGRVFSSMLNFHFYANGGNFGAGLTPTTTFPVALNSYTANFDVENTRSNAPAANVLFTGPGGSGLSAAAAVAQNSFIGPDEARYQSPGVSNPVNPPTGTWTVSYHGTNLTFNPPAAQATSRLVIPFPTVTVTSGNLTAVSWVYKDAATGTTLGQPPGYLTDLQVQVRSSFFNDFFEQYFDSLPSQLKNTIRRKSKQLAKTGNFRIEIITTPDQAEHAITAYGKVYNASWKVPEPYPEFIPGLIRTYAASGALRLGLAYLDNEPVAAQIWIVSDGIASIYKLAYDERYAKLSAGSVLTTRLMERVIDVDKVHEIDYLNCGDWVESCTALVEHDDGRCGHRQRRRELLVALIFSETVEHAACPRRFCFCLAHYVPAPAFGHIIG